MRNRPKRSYSAALALDHVDRPSHVRRRWRLYAALALILAVASSLAWSDIRGAGPARLEAAKSGQPAVQSFGRYLSPDQFTAAALTAGWTEEELPAIRALVDCETHGSFDTQSYNPDDPNGGSYGLAQLNGAQHFLAADEDFSQRFDPVTNLRVARWLYRARDGFGGTGGWLLCAQQMGVR